METKWTSHATDLSARRLAPEVLKAINQARDGAGRIEGLLRRTDVATKVIPVVMYWGPNVTPPAVALGMAFPSQPGSARRGRHDRLASRVREWRVGHEDNGVRIAVAARLRHANRLGRAAIGLALLMVVLVPLSRASDFIDAVLGLAGSVLAVSATLVPVVTALAAAYVWLARQLDPEVPWIPGLIPLGAWVAGFASILLMTS